MNAADTFRSILESRRFDWTKASILDDGIQGFHVARKPGTVSPEEFLDFAEKDLADADKRSLVNALSNAKRAIDSELKRVTEIFRIPISGNKRPRLELLQEMGILAPRILQRIHDRRNMLEHEFKQPKRSLVEDTVDVAALFVFAVERTLHEFPEVVYLFEGSPDAPWEDCIRIAPDWRNARIKVYERKGDIFRSPSLGAAAEFKNDHPLYLKLVRVLIAAQTERNEQGAIGALHEALYPKKS